MPLAPSLCSTTELISHNQELSYPVGTQKAFGDPWLCSLPNQPPAGTHLFQADLLWILQLPCWLGHWHHYNVIAPASTSKIGVRTDWLKQIKHAVIRSINIAVKTFKRTCFHCDACWARFKTCVARTSGSNEGQRRTDWDRSLKLMANH